MKTISRYASIITVGSLLSGSVLLAQTSGSTSSSSNTDPATTKTYGGTTSGTTSGATGTAAESTSSDMTVNSGLPRDRSSMSGRAMGMADELTSTLESADFNSRSQIVSQVEQKMDSNKDMLKAAKRDSKNLQGQAKSNYKAAWDDLEAREKDLKHSLRQARNANQSGWDSARSQLSSNYQAYQAAVARVHTAAMGMSGGMMNEDTSGTRSSSDTTSGMNSGSSTGTSTPDATTPRSSTDSSSANSSDTSNK